VRITANTNFLYKDKSVIDGTGVFTKILIPKGEIFYLIPMNEIFLKSASRLAYIGNSRYVNDDKVLNWINHSCDSNTKLDISTDQPYLVSKRDIQPKEEILCDYSETEIMGSSVTCLCKSQNCRGYFLVRK